MHPKLTEHYFARLDQAAKALRKNNFAAHVVETAQDVLEIINELNSDVPVLSALAEGPFEGEAGPALATVGQVAELAAATPITTYLGATRLDAAWLDLLTFDLAQQTSRARRPL